MANTPQRKYFSLTALKKALSSTFGTLVCLSKPLSSLWQKFPKQYPNPKTTKKYLTPLLCGLLLMPAFVSAKQDHHEGMFDSLLRIILPFYKKEPAPATDTPTDDMDEIPSMVDDGTDDGYVIDEEMVDSKTAKKPLDLPSVLLDDTLIADDSVAMLGEPDLYALLSAEFAADRGNIKEALTIYKAESFKKNATNVFERALSLSIEYEEPSQSLAFATAWQKQNRDHIPAWFYVAHLALKAGDYNQASQTLGMILNYDATADLTQILTGIIPDNPDSQRKLFNALTAVGDNNPAISVLRAGLLMRLGDYEPALLHVDTALNKDPTNLSYITLKIDLLKLSNKDDRLWQFVRTKRKQLPMHKELHLYEIHHLIEKGDLKSAWQLLQVANRATKDPEIILLTALTGLDIGEYGRAERILLPLLNNSDYQSRANYYLGISHEMRGNINKAREYYEKVKDYEHVLDARTKVVGFYLVNDEVDKAIATLIRLRDEYKIYATDSYLLQAEILMRQNEKQTALNLLTSANRENPDDDRLLFASYKLLENELSNDDKRETLNKLISIDPYNHEYLLSDAKLRLLQNPNDTDALKVATTISKISESDPNYDEQLQFDALMLLANHALNQQDFKSVITYIKAPYENTRNLNAGILLLKAYQGLNENDKVMALLDELKGNTPNLTSTHQEKVAN